MALRNRSFPIKLLLLVLAFSMLTILLSVAARMGY